MCANKMKWISKKNLHRVENVCIKKLSYFPISRLTPSLCLPFTRDMKALYLWFIWFCVISMEFSTAGFARGIKVEVNISFEAVTNLEPLHVNDFAWRFHFTSICPRLFAYLSKKIQFSCSYAVFAKGQTKQIYF